MHVCCISGASIPSSRTVVAPITMVSASLTRAWPLSVSAVAEDVSAIKAMATRNMPPTRQPTYNVRPSGPIGNAIYLGTGAAGGLAIVAPRGEVADNGSEPDACPVTPALVKNCWAGACSAFLTN